MKINKKKKKRKLVHNFVKSKVNQLSKDTLKVFIMAGHINAFVHGMQ